MDEPRMEVFLHRRGQKPEMVAGEETESLRGLLARNGVNIGDEDVFVGECEDALRDFGEGEAEDDLEDEHAAANIDCTLKELDLRGRRHIHVSACRRIAVTAEFGRKTKRRRFSPAATIAAVTEWAKRVLNLDRKAAEEYVLQLCNSTIQPRPDQHLGEIVDGDACAVCFDLVKEITPQG